MDKRHACLAAPPHGSRFVHSLTLDVTTWFIPTVGQSHPHPAPIRQSHIQRRSSRPNQPALGGAILDFHGSEVRSADNWLRKCVGFVDEN